MRSARYEGPFALEVDSIDEGTIVG